MTYSTKLLLKILIGGLITGTLGGVLWSSNHKELYEIMEAVGFLVAGICFIAFVVALVLSAKRGH